MHLKKGIKRKIVTADTKPVTKSTRAQKTQQKVGVRRQYGLVSIGGSLTHATLPCKAISCFAYHCCLTSQALVLTCPLT